MAVASEHPGALDVVNGVDTVVEVDMVVEQQREEVRCQLLGDGL